MTKMIIIDRCADCPEMGYIEYLGVACKYMEMSLDDVRLIPDWCPLKDLIYEFNENGGREKALKILKRIEESLEQDEYYGLEEDFKRLREMLEEQL